MVLRLSLSHFFVRLEFESRCSYASLRSLAFDFPNAKKKESGYIRVAGAQAITIRSIG